MLAVHDEGVPALQALATKRRVREADTRLALCPVGVGCLARCAARTSRVCGVDDVGRIALLTDADLRVPGAVAGHARCELFGWTGTRRASSTACTLTIHDAWGLARSAPAVHVSGLLIWSGTQRLQGWL